MTDRPTDKVNHELDAISTGIITKNFNCKISVKFNVKMDKLLLTIIFHQISMFSNKLKLAAG